MQKNDTIQDMTDETRGRPQIEGLKDFLLSLSIEDQAWFKEHLKGRAQPDGTKDNLSAWVRRQMAAHREQVEKDELYAKTKGTP
jgi:hypothetical protein